MSWENKEVKELRRLMLRVRIKNEPIRDSRKRLTLLHRGRGKNISEELYQFAKKLIDEKERIHKERASKESILEEQEASSKVQPEKSR